MSDQPKISFHDGNSIPQVGLGVWQTPNDTAAPVTMTYRKALPGFQGLPGYCRSQHAKHCTLAQVRQDAAHVARRERDAAGRWLVS